MLIVFTTVPNSGEGKALAERIVREKLAACVQIVPKMTSVYFWDGAIRKESEHLMLIKTTQEKYLELEKFISANHSYDVPEIVALPAAEVSSGYLKWMTDYLG